MNVKWQIPKLVLGSVNEYSSYGTRKWEIGFIFVLNKQSIEKCFHA